MSNELIRIESVASFRLTSLIRTDKALTPSQKAVGELFQCFDEVLLKAPLEVRDFLLRFWRSCGMPIDYEGLPIWAEKAARHVFTICYPTLRKADFSNLTTEDFGKMSGHLWAMIARSKEGTGIFQRLPKETANELRVFFTKIEPPMRVLVNEGLSLPFKEAEAFTRGFQHALSRTFDVMGLPCGWNTNSYVMLGICLGWRYIVTNSPTLSALHRDFVKLFGNERQEIGTEDRVKKICHRLGLRFTGNRATGSQGTTVILDVPTERQMISDK